jgi:hypothetical protein
MEKLKKIWVDLEGNASSYEDVINKHCDGREVCDMEEIAINATSTLRLFADMLSDYILDEERRQTEIARDEICAFYRDEYHEDYCDVCVLDRANCRYLYNAHTITEAKKWRENHTPSKTLDMIADGMFSSAEHAMINGYITKGNPSQEEVAEIYARNLDRWAFAIKSIARKIK